MRKKVNPYLVFLAATLAATMIFTILEINSKSINSFGWYSSNPKESGFTRWVSAITIIAINPAKQR